MQLIVVRHGETQFNKQHRLMGQSFDLPLDEQGLSQAEALIQQLPKDAAMIFSSPLKRAAQTAEIISRHLNLPAVTDDALKERDFGSLTGKTWEEINAQTGQDLHAVDEQLKYDYQPYGGEDVAQVKQRLLEFLDRLRRNHERDKVIVVAHYGLIMLLNQLFGHKHQESLGNLSIHTYEI